MVQKESSAKKITLAHGNGGRHSHELYSSIICRHFDNPLLASLSDSAILENMSAKLAFSTDSYVVKPLFFPGGDIGKLAVCGTVNDIAVMGARPFWMSCSLIIEEGFAFDSLDAIIGSMARTAKECGVTIVTGDTKVVEGGSCDGIYINTAGIGYFDPDDPGFSQEKIVNGDVLVITGTAGDHGTAILTARENFPVRSGIQSDCAPLAGLIRSILESVAASEIRVMRDPTRGGLATTLNELVSGTGVGMEIDESSIPIREDVRSLCEMAGYDPLYIANEGKAVIVVSLEASDSLLSAVRAHPLGANAAIIGRVTLNYPGTVTMRTAIGGGRILDMLTADMFPRIC
jgi:hydrogenase expression/formation protein HypE